MSTNKTIRFDLAESPGVGVRTDAAPTSTAWETDPPAVGLSVERIYTLGYELGRRDGIPSSPDHTLVAVIDGTSAYDRAISDAHRRGRELSRAEMWSRLEMLAQDVSDGAYHTEPFDNERLADVIRGVARG